MDSKSECFNAIFKHEICVVYACLDIPLGHELELFIRPPYVFSKEFKHLFKVVLYPKFVKIYGFGKITKLVLFNVL